MAHEWVAPKSPPRPWLELFAISRIERAGPVLVKYGRFCDGDGGDQAARLAQASISTLSAGVASDEMNSSVMHGR